MTDQEVIAATELPTKGNRGRFVKGQKKPNQGKRGPAKITKALKDMILGALDDAGGQKYLTEQAMSNPGPFLALVGKVLPVTLAGDANNPIVVQIVRYADVDPDRP